MFHVSKAGMVSLVTVFGLAVAGCGGSDGQDGQDGVTTRIADIAPGEVCTSGGIEVGLGVDSDGDGELSDGEVTQTKIICNGDDGTDGADGADGADGTDGIDGTDGVDGQDGTDGVDGADGANSLIKLTTESAGANCAAGGYRLDTGLDNGDGGEVAADGILGAGEVDATNYVCHGVDGFTVLTTLTPAAPANCPNGGQRLDIGLDNGDNLGTLRDGILQTGEIDSTAYLCNGADGQDGSDGLNGANGSDGTDGTNGTDGTDGTNGSDGADGQDGQTTLIKQAMASVANCPDGGVTITSGLDNGDGGGVANNAVLESGEVDYTQHVCNGSSGGGNQLVDANSVVLGSVLNANLETVSIRTPNNYLVTINWDGSFNPEDTTYSAAGCTGTAHIYIDDTQKTIHPSAAFWSANESGFLVPNNPGADAAVESQDLPYQSYMLNEVCTNDTGTVWMWPASVLSATTIGLPATITAPLSLQ